MEREEFVRRLGILTILLGCGLMPSAVVAESESAEISVWTIRATEEPSEIPKELKTLSKVLESSFKFKGYHLLNQVDGKVGEEAKRFELAEGYFAKIKHVETKDGKIKLDITVMVLKKKPGEEKPKPEKKLATTVSLTPEKHQLMGGWKIKGDDRMIIAISAK